jgi:hypothetical protein
LILIRKMVNRKERREIICFVSVIKTSIAIIVFFDSNFFKF